MSEDANHSLGARLRSLRHLHQWSMQDVKDRAGVSKGYLSRLENGENGRPSVEIMRALANVYGVSLDDLMPLRQAQSHRRPAPLFGTLTDAEETALLDYLAFLRWKNRDETRRPAAGEEER